MANIEQKVFVYHNYSNLDEIINNLSALGYEIVSAIENPATRGTRRSLTVTAKRNKDIPNIDQIQKIEKDIDQLRKKGEEVLAERRILISTEELKDFFWLGSFINVVLYITLTILGAYFLFGSFIWGNQDSFSIITGLILLAIGVAVFLIQRNRSKKRKDILNLDVVNNPNNEEINTLVRKVKDLL